MTQTEIIIDDICAECKNYFVVDKHSGIFEIVDGVISPLDFIADGQYFRVVGSVFNDGVHCKPCEDLQDETFNGSVWAMAIPRNLLDIAKEVEEFSASDAAKASPYTSESFGGYSYTKATTEKGEPLTWQAAFASKLNRYRRIHL